MQGYPGGPRARGLAKFFFNLSVIIPDSQSPSVFEHMANPVESLQSIRTHACAFVFCHLSCQWFDKRITLRWPVALGFRSLSHQFPAPNYQRNTSRSLIIPAR